MNDHDLRMLALLPLLAGLCCAAWIDIRQRRIPNWLTAGICVAGVAQSFFALHVATPGQSLLGLIAGFGIGLAMVVLRAWGGGDVKLLAGVGAWIGAFGAVQTLVIAALVGLVMVLVQCAWQRRLSALFRNSALLGATLANVHTIGVEGVAETGSSFRSIDRPLPYAVPVLIAVLILACR